MVRKFISISLIGLLLVSCAPQHGGPKQGMGTILGGIGGALIGSQFGGGDGAIAMTALGAVAGAALGNTIGESMDAQDKRMAGQAAMTSFETARSGTVTAWRNPDNGHHGSFTPVRTFQRNDGRYCREFQQKIVVGGKVQEGYGTACRQPDGNWEITN